MKKSILSIALTIVMVVLSAATSHSQSGYMAYAKETSSDPVDMLKEFEEALKGLDNLGDIDNLDDVTTSNIQNSTGNKSTIETDMMIAVGDGYTLGLKTDGTVISTGLSLSGADQVSDWSNITMIACGNNHSVGLKSDGTVVAVGSSGSGECDVEEWKDIKMIVTGQDFTIGLKKNGTVVATGSNEHGVAEVEDWKNIVSVSAGSHVTVGLKSDGTVLAIGKDCLGILDVGEWRDIIEIQAAVDNIIGLKKDGTVVNTMSSKTSEFKDVIAIDASLGYEAGLKKDGTVVTTSDTINVSSWKNIIAISASGSHLVGLKSDGTVVAIEANMTWDVGQCDVQGWMLKVEKEKAVTATSTNSKIEVNSKKFTIEAYMINKSTYVKIRDLAYVLKGTNNKFSVAGDGLKKSIKINSKTDYKAIGGELAKGDKKPKVIVKKSLEIYVDGEKVKFSVYEINNEIYFKLHDIMKKLNIYVKGSAAKGITIDTKKAYK